MSIELQKPILQTLAFWDIFDYPLTKEELYRGFYSTDCTGTNFAFSLFIESLSQFADAGSIGYKDGFYFLLGREEIVAKRQLKVKLIEEKIKIAKRGIKKMAWVPFLRAVFVCNTVGMGITEEDSDVDVFIIVKKGRLWLSRFLVTSVLSLFNLRRTKNKIKNKICLSFYVTDDNLNLESVALKSDSSAKASAVDIYLIYWLNNLIPIYDPNNLHERIMKANQWVKKYLPNGLQSYAVDGAWGIKLETISKFAKKFFEKVWNSNYGEMLENQAKSFQKAKMKSNYSSVQNEPDTRVIVSDSMLKFHEKDRREEYKKLWLEKCEKYG